MTGAAPLSTSIRWTSFRFSVGIAGLKAPPQGISSITRRKASNYCNPQKDGTALDGPASPPRSASSGVARSLSVREGSFHGGTWRDLVAATRVALSVSYDAFISQTRDSALQANSRESPSPASLVCTEITAWNHLHSTAPG